MFSDRIVKAMDTVRPEDRNAVLYTSAMALHLDLEHLILLHDHLEDDRRGYMDATERAEDPLLKDLLATIGARRVMLITEVNTLLQKAISHNGTQVHRATTYEPHPAWEDLRDPVSKPDGLTVLDTCERQEGFLLTRMDALDRFAASAETHQLIHRQRTEVQENLENITFLRRHIL